MLKIIKDRRLLSLFLSTLLVFASFTAFFPVLPLHLKALGASNFMVGAVMSSFPVGVLLFRPVVSRALEKKGRRWTLMFGTISLSASTLLYLVAATPMALAVVRFLHGVGISAFTQASIVLISDITTQKNRGEIMGYMGVANYVGFGVGPYLAGRLYADHSAQFVFIYAAVAALFATVSLLWLSADQKPHHHHHEKLSFIRTISHRWILVPSLFILIASLVQGSIVIFMPVFLKEVAALDSGPFFLVFSFSVLFSRIVAGKTADRYGRGIVLLGASLFIAAAIGTLWQTRTEALLVLAAVFYGIGYGSQQPTMSAYVADNTNYHTRGAIFGFYYAVFDIGVLTAGYLFGAVADYLSLLYIYPVALGLYALSTLFFLLNIESTPGKSLQWIFSLRSKGPVCQFCQNAAGVDPCLYCKNS